MALTIRQASADTFEDLVDVLGPKRPGAKGCWCLGYRLGHAGETELDAAQRVDFVASLCRSLPHGPGLLAYDGTSVVGWAGVGPKSDMHEFSSSKRYRSPDDRPAWVVWCFRVPAGAGGRGVASALLRGAVEHAASAGASVLEGYPVDNRGEKVDRTMASFGLYSMFERAGFVKIRELGQRGGFPQVMVRRDLDG